MAAVAHDNVVKRSQVIDGAIQAAALQAVKDVQQAVQPLPTDVVQAVNAQVSDARAKNADATAKGIDVADTQRTALLNQVQVQVINNEAAAQRQLNTDTARSLDDPVVTQVQPPQPWTGWQRFTSYVPDYKTVLFIGGGLLLGTAALLIPGAGPVLFVLGMGWLAASTAYNASDRFFTQDQTLGQAALGAAGDATGGGSLYTGLTGRDLATDRHLGLTEAQQNQTLTVGAIQTGLTLYGGYRGARSFLGGRAPTAPKPPTEPPATSGLKPTVPQPPTTPAKAGYGSNAGKAGAAEAAQTVTPCFRDGTLICAASGLKLIESIRAGDLVWSRLEDRPESDVVLKRVEEVFVRTSPILRVSVGGRVIGVTANHPFWVEGQGWLEAGLLQVGDLLRSSDNRLIAVSSVADSGEVATVYNFHVADYHTYFVGGDNWDFDVWTHNTAAHPTGSGSSGSTRTDAMKEQLFERPGKPRSQSAVRGAQTELKGGQVEAAIKQGRTFDHVKKVWQAQRGLLKRIAGIQKELSDPNLSQAARQELQVELSQASKLLDATEGFVPR